MKKQHYAISLPMKTAAFKTAPGSCGSSTGHTQVLHSEDSYSEGLHATYLRVIEVAYWEEWSDRPICERKSQSPSSICFSAVHSVCLAIIPQNPGKMV